MGRLIDLDKVEFLKVDGNIEFNHGVDCCINTLLKQSPVEAIPKDQFEEQIKTNNRLVTDNKQLRADIVMMRLDYEAKLKADMMAMLTELQAEIEEVPKYRMTHNGICVYREAEEYISDINKVIQQKIDNLEER